MATEIDFSRLSVAELGDLISRASEELCARAKSPILFQVRDELPINTVAVPKRADLAMIRSALSDLKTGSVILASEKDEYARLAKLYPAWFELKRLPVSLRRDTRGFIKHGIVP